MKINLYSRNRTLYIDYKENDKRVRRSLKIQDTKANREYAVRNIYPKIENRLKSGIDSTINLKLSSYLDRVITETEKPTTKENYKVFIKRVFDFLDDKDINEYLVLDIESASKKMQRKGLSPATIRAYFAPVRLAFNIAYRQGIINKNPVILPKLRKYSKVEIKPYNLFEVSNLLKNATGELKLFLYFAFYTGARSGEILALTWGDIKDSYIIISKTKNMLTKELGLPKNNKAREVFLLSQLKEHLKRVEYGADDEFIFKRTYASVVLNFKKLCRKLGYKEQGLHSTRHTFISIAVSSGVDLALVQKMVGHSNLNMIMEIYTHYVDDSHKVKELEKALDTSLTQDKIG